MQLYNLSLNKLGQSGYKADYYKHISVMHVHEILLKYI